MGKPFVINRHGRLVFPSNFLADLDFTVIETEEQLAVVRRDFEAKAPTGTDIMAKPESGGYATRYELMRDVALNLFWVNRFAMTMYEKRPIRWRDVPRRREDVFLPILTPWQDGERKVAAVRRAIATLPRAWDAEAEDRIFGVLFDVFRHSCTTPRSCRRSSRPSPRRWPTPSSLTFCLRPTTPTSRSSATTRSSTAREEVPELEALHALVDGAAQPVPVGPVAVRLTAVGELDDDDVRGRVHARATAT